MSAYSPPLSTLSSAYAFQGLLRYNIGISFVYFENSTGYQLQSQCVASVKLNAFSAFFRLYLVVNALRIALTGWHAYAQA